LRRTTGSKWFLASPARAKKLGSRHEWPGTRACLIQKSLPLNALAFRGVNIVKIDRNRWMAQTTHRVAGAQVPCWAKRAQRQLPNLRFLRQCSHGWRRPSASGPATLPHRRHPVAGPTFCPGRPGRYAMRSCRRYFRRQLLRICSQLLHPVGSTPHPVPPGNSYG